MAGSDQVIVNDHPDWRGKLQRRLREIRERGQSTTEGEPAARAEGRPQSVTGAGYLARRALAAQSAAGGSQIPITPPGSHHSMDPDSDESASGGAESGSVFSPLAAEEGETEMARRKHLMSADDIGADFEAGDAQDMRNFEAARLLMETALDREMTKINRAFRNAEGLKGAKLQIALSFTRDKKLANLLNVKVDSATTLRALTTEEAAMIADGQLQMTLPRGIENDQPADPTTGGTELERVEVGESEVR